MFGVLSLLRGLTDDDIKWIFEVGQERQVITGTVLIQEGAKPDALHFVLEGLMGVTVSSAGDKQIATLGPGEMMGEISFIEGTPATATITAAENSLLLLVPFDLLDAKLAEDQGFAARLYKSFAVISSARLRERVRTLGQQLRNRAAVDEALPDRWQALEGAVKEFKAQMLAADREALKNDGEISNEFRQALIRGFLDFSELLNRELGDNAPVEQHLREELGARVKVEVLPYLLLTGTAERCYSKPRGYAGDFMSIEMIYQNSPNGSGRLGPALDDCFLQTPAAKAVRNRRGLLAEEIERACGESTGDAVRVTSLACGPAEEIFDVLATSTHASRLVATLLDIDLQALAFVTDKATKKKLSRQIKPVNGNLVYLATGRQQLNVPPQDLVYSLGLIDYFNDTFVIKLLDYVHGLLRSGGRVILGNFHPSNPTKALMDHVLDWKLIHRSEEDMNRLFAASKFQRGCTQIRFEPAGVNLFAMCEKT